MHTELDEPRGYKKHDKATSPSRPGYVACKYGTAIPLVTQIQVWRYPSGSGDGNEGLDSSRAGTPKSRASPVGTRMSAASATLKPSVRNTFPFTRKVTSPIPAELPLLRYRLVKLPDASNSCAGHGITGISHKVVNTWLI